MDNADAVLAARELESYAKVFRTRLGASALSASVMEALLPVLEQSIGEMQRAYAMVEDLEEKEAFGDEESYWTTFRLFCSEANRGRAHSLDVVWSYLAMNYDMSKETDETLAETLDDWKTDIEADALAKFKLVGEFKEIDGKYAFVVIEDRSPKPRAQRQPKSIVAPASTPSAELGISTEDHTEPTEHNLVVVLGNILNASGSESVRQADFVREIQALMPDVSREEIIAMINELHAAGSLVKYKPVNGGAARICLNAETVAAQVPNSQTSDVDASESSERLRDEMLDYVLASKIISHLIDTLTHVQQKVPTSTVRTALADTDMSLTDRDINATIRSLENMGVVETDRGALLGGGGKKLSKGRTLQVLRVGIASQEVKMLVKRLIDEDKLDEYLQALVLLKVNVAEAKSLFDL